jgi:hypothetical protein
MIGVLYRYSHPDDPSRFIYVGQTQHIDNPEKRDKQHRLGRSTFGRRFKKKFPKAELSQPIRERVEVSDSMELNELEIVWMFRFHTWRGYPDGMNVVLPGAQDYKAAAILGGQANVDSGHIQALGRKQVIKIRGLGGKVSGKNVGRRNVESGQMASIQREGSRAGTCVQYYIGRGKPCICGRHTLGSI